MSEQQEPELDMTSKHPVPIPEPEGMEEYQSMMETSGHEELTSDE